MGNFLELTDVCFQYLAEAKNNTLDHASLTIEQGKTTVLVGGSGCGKSTLALLAAGIYPENGGVLSCGEIRLMGKKLSGLTVPQRAVLLTVLFQNPDLQFCMDTLRKELIFCLENLSASPGGMEQRVEEFAESYGVTALLDRNLHTLSGGEKQKAALCCMLLMGAEGILLDEPFSNIDPDSVPALMHLLKKQRTEQNTTIIAIDHKLDQWLDLADEIIVLGVGGKILARGITRENMGNYRELFRREGLFFPEQLPGFRPAPVDTAPVLVLEKVSFGYGKNKLAEKVNASFCEGSVTALLGPSGAGKTSLFHAVLGQLRYEGSVRLFGTEIKKLKKKELYSQVSAVFQNPANQFVALNVLEEAKKGLETWETKKSGEELEGEALELLDRYGLKKYRRYSPYMLSQGQQRRLAVLSVLAGKQKLLLLDEPTYGQDRRNTQAIMEHLRGLCEQGLTVIFSTHDRDTAFRYSDGVYQLKEGRLAPWNG